MSRALVALLASALVSFPASKPMSFAPMWTCFTSPPAELMAGSRCATVLPRLRKNQVQVLTVWSSHEPSLGLFARRPRWMIVADAADNHFIAELQLSDDVLVGVPVDPVPRKLGKTDESQRIYRDMDAVLPDFASGRQPTSLDVVAARDRLRVDHAGMISKEHVIVYQRLSPAWFAFLDGDPKFAEKVAP